MNETAALLLGLSCVIIFISFIFMFSYCWANEELIKKEHNLQPIEKDSVPSSEDIIQITDINISKVYNGSIVNFKDQYGNWYHNSRTEWLDGNYTYQLDNYLLGPEVSDKFRENLINRLEKLYQESIN